MWSVEFNDASAKAFRKLDGKTQRAVKSKLQELQALQNPGVHAKPLMHDLKGRWRLRMGGYRIIFSLERQRMLILVVDIGRRDDIYG